MPFTGGSGGGDGPRFDIPFTTLHPDLPRRVSHHRPNKTILGAVVHHENSPTPAGGNPIAFAHSRYMHGHPTVGVHYIIERDGGLYYTLDVTERADHDQGLRGLPATQLPKFPNGIPDFDYWDDHYLCVLLMGNCHRRPANPRQIKSLVLLLTVLAEQTALWSRFEILGRREIPGTRTVCPGKYVDLDWLRKEVAGNLDSARTLAAQDWSLPYTEWRDAAFAEHERAEYLAKQQALFVPALEDMGRTVDRLQARIVDLIRQAKQPKE